MKKTTVVVIGDIPDDQGLGHHFQLNPDWPADVLMIEEDESAVHLRTGISMPERRVVDVMIDVFTASISHTHGTEVFFALTEERLEEKLAEYCRDNWDEVLTYNDDCEDDVPETPPDDDEKCVSIYFDHSEDHQEFLERYDNQDVSLLDVIGVLRNL